MSPRLNGYRRWWSSLNKEERDAFCRKRGVARQTHGMSRHPLYNTWKNMLHRCYHLNHPSYPEWGGRGIMVYVEWRLNPRPFIQWALAQGWVPGLEIDRRNNNGNYTPNNCRLVNDKEQAQNRRPRRLTAAGREVLRQSVIATNQRRLSRGIRV